MTNPHAGRGDSRLPSAETPWSSTAISSGSCCAPGATAIECPGGLNGLAAGHQGSAAGNYPGSSSQEGISGVVEKDFRARSVSDLDRRATVEMMRFNEDQQKMVFALGAMTSWSEVQKCCRHTREKGAISLNLGSTLGRVVLTEEEFDA